MLGRTGRALCLLPSPPASNAKLRVSSRGYVNGSALSRPRLSPLGVEPRRPRRCREPTLANISKQSLAEIDVLSDGRFREAIQDINRRVSACWWRASRHGCLREGWLSRPASGRTASLENSLPNCSCPPALSCRDLNRAFHLRHLAQSS
jgi:hypothetical protein